MSSQTKELTRVKERKDFCSYFNCSAIACDVKPSSFFSGLQEGVGELSKRHLAMELIYMGNARFAHGQIGVFF